MSARLKKLQKDYIAFFGNAPRGRSCNSEAWLKDQIEQRVALLKVKKGDKGDKGDKGNDAVVAASYLMLVQQQVDTDSESGSETADITALRDIARSFSTQMAHMPRSQIDLCA
jgi:hypothetical protein